MLCTLFQCFSFSLSLSLAHTHMLAWLCCSVEPCLMSLDALSWRFIIVGQTCPFPYQTKTHVLRFSLSLPPTLYLSLSPAGCYIGFALRKRPSLGNLHSFSWFKLLKQFLKSKPQQPARKKTNFARPWQPFSLSSCCLLLSLSLSPSLWALFSRFFFHRRLFGNALCSRTLYSISFFFFATPFFFGLARVALSYLHTLTHTHINCSLGKFSCTSFYCFLRLNPRLLLGEGSSTQGSLVAVPGSSWQRNHFGFSPAWPPLPPLLTPTPTPLLGFFEYAVSWPH